MFITLEGPEGGGKTTQARRLADWLSALGHDVLLLREPGGTGVGDAVRKIVLDNAAGNLDARAELLLFCASRAQLVADRIRPHLAQRGIVVCDRFSDSTLAYQGYGRGFDLDFLKALLAFATLGTRPDLTLLLDIDIEAGLQRREKAEWNRLDAETIEFHRRVRAGYFELAATEPERWAVVQASQATDDVTQQILAIVKNRLPRAENTV